MPEVNNPSFDISVIIPCFEEENHLQKSVEVVYNLLNSTIYTFEIIFVDDCSKDKTRDIIIMLASYLPNTKYFFHDANTGRGGTFLDGVKRAQGKYIGFLDIDLEVSPAYLLPIILELEKGYDVATVCRHYPLAPSAVFILRHILSVGYKILISQYLDIPRMDTETGFKFFKSEVILKLSENVQNKGWFFDTEVMALAYLNKFKIKEVHGLFRRNIEKKSTVRLFRDTIDYFTEVYKFKKRLSKAAVR